MIIKLLELELTNFKGQKHFVFNPDGKNACLVGKYGRGKTTVKDAFTWLFFGKNAEDKQKFEVKPLDADNNVIEGLDTSVFGRVSFDGDVMTFKRGLDASRNTLCWINDAPKKVNEFKSTISELIPEDKFKMFTDLLFFNEKLPWKDRREKLTEMIPPIEPPAEFADVIENMDGKNDIDYRTMIKQKLNGVYDTRDKGLKGELAAISPRIEEQQKNVLDSDNDADLIAQRESLQQALDGLAAERVEVVSSEADRARKLDEVNDLKSKRAVREGELQAGVGGHEHLFAEKESLRDEIAERESALRDITRQTLSKKADLSIRKDSMDNICSALKKIQTDYLCMKEADFSKAVCSACGQTLTPEGIKELKESNLLKMKHLAAKGNQIVKIEKPNHQKAIDNMTEEIKALDDKYEADESELKELRINAAKRIAEIDATVKAGETVSVQDDPKWQSLSVKIHELLDAAGPSIADQLEAIEASRNEISDKVEEINKALSMSDVSRKAKERIAELSAREKELGVEIAKWEGKLNRLEEMQLAQSKQIEDAVNGKFDHVKFKLFEMLQNGNVQSCCTAMLNGTPWADCSYSEKNLIGADVINILSKYHGFECPIFIDNAESITCDLSLNCQEIRLIAEWNKDELTAIVDQEEKSSPSSTTPADVEIETPNGEDSVDEQERQSSPIYICTLCGHEFETPKGTKKSKLCPKCFTDKIELT